jgi:pyruvoyl-dependent arginine decarboxylase (PvlArgDC)
MPKHLPTRYSEIGIPKEYFWVIGWGERDVGIEIGSYDAALYMAGIENYNVMLYTSVLQPETVELSYWPDIHHGSVLEVIIAVQHSDKPGTRITAGLLLAKVYRNSDRLTWAVLRASMPATDRSKKRKPIYGRRCSSFCAALSNQVPQTRD